MADRRRQVLQTFLKNCHRLSPTDYMTDVINKVVNGFLSVTSHTMIRYGRFLEQFMVLSMARHIHCGKTGRGFQSVHRQ